MKIKKGFALTEVLLAIAVIIIIGVATYGLYKSSRDKIYVNQQVSDLLQIKVNVDKGYPSHNFSSISAVQLYQLGLLPEDLASTYDGTSIYIYNKSSVLNIVPDALRGNQYFDLVLSGLPADQGQCVQFMTALVPLFSTIGTQGFYSSNLKNVNSPNPSPQEIQQAACTGTFRIVNLSDQ